jgi:hypothetical protein
MMVDLECLTLKVALILQVVVVEAPEVSEEMEQDQVDLLDQKLVVLVVSELRFLLLVLQHIMRVVGVVQD